MSRSALWCALVGLVVAAGCRDLAVLSVSPAEVPAGQASEISVSGRGFEEGLALRLESAGLEVGLAPVVVEASESADARVPSAAPPGVYDLVGELDGARATLVNALRIVSGEARITFIDVGQGDGTLVVAPTGEALLIDGGGPGAADEVRAAIDREAGGRLDAVVLSHFDADHLGGLVGVLSGDDGVAGTEDDLVPEDAIGPTDDGGCETQTCGRMRQLLAWPFEVATPGRLLTLGAVEVEVVSADGVVAGALVPGVDDSNEQTVAVLVRFGGRSVLVTGDLTGGGIGTADVESEVAAFTGPVDILRVSHHGSGTSSVQAALSTWAPRAAVFSFGTDNAYCHPDADVLARVAASSGAVYATGRGVVEAVDRCAAPTLAPAGARLGLGDVLLRVSVDGSMTLQDDAL